MSGNTIYHVVDAAAWAQAREAGMYAPPDLAYWGFLHCCTGAQLDFVLRRHFAGRTGLLLLSLDPANLSARLLWEKSEADQDPFPHLYGPLPLNEVQSVQPVSPPRAEERA